MILDRIDNYRLYPWGEVWGKVFTFLGELNSNAAPGRISIVGDKLYAVVAEYKTRSRDQVQFESHRTYIDVQCLIRGAERIEYAPTSLLTIQNEYDREKDVIFYPLTEKPQTSLLLEPGMFALFFPDDGHLPGQISQSAPQAVKKVVVKISQDLLIG